MRSAMLLAIMLAGMPASDHPMTTDRESWSRHAESELDSLDALVRKPRPTGAWGRLHALYRECPDCCRSSASESFGWISATLFANHWALRQEFISLALSDPGWLDFVLQRLHGPIDAKLLRRAAHNMKDCPAKQKRVCERIKVNALEAAKDVEADAASTQ